MSSYNFTIVRMMAKDIADKIGVENLYSEKNTRYPKAPANFHLSNINNIILFIKNYLNATGNTKQLIIIEDKQVGENIFGLYVHYNDTAYIKLNSQLNYCWNRFATLKELCSLYVDHYDKDVMRYTNYLDSLKNAFNQKEIFLTQSVDLDSDLDSETFSILLAIELMIPKHKRDITKSLLNEVPNKKITMNDIAKSLLIPEFILQLYADKGLIDAAPQYEDFGA